MPSPMRVEYYRAGVVASFRLIPKNFEGPTSSFKLAVVAVVF